MSLSSFAQYLINSCRTGEFAAPAKKANTFLQQYHAGKKLTKREPLEIYQKPNIIYQIGRFKAQESTKGVGQVLSLPIFRRCWGELAGFLPSDRRAGPDLRHRGVFVSDVVREIVAGRAEELDGVFSDVRDVVHGAAGDGVAG
jgi:hypothetical protein